MLAANLIRTAGVSLEVGPGLLFAKDLRAFIHCNSTASKFGRSVREGDMICHTSLCLALLGIYPEVYSVPLQPNPYEDYGLRDIMRPASGDIGMAEEIARRIDHISVTRGEVDKSMDTRALFEILYKNGITRGFWVELWALHGLIVPAEQFELEVVSR